MNSFKLFSALFISLLLFSCAAHAPKVVDTKSIQTSGVTEEVLTAEESAIVASIPGPPAPESEEDQSDVAKLLTLQETRTEKDCARAKTEAEFSLQHFFGPPYGPLKMKEVEKLNPFYEEINRESYRPNLIGAAKKKWHRIRPFSAHPEIEPCVKKEPSFSYPSGHTAMSRIYSLALSEVFPKLRKKLLWRANQIALDRMIGGVHYPSDVRDAKILADRIFQYMKKREDFQKALAEAKAQF